MGAILGSGGALSNLYIRVFTGIYSNRKTLRLRVQIGDDAFWVPLRMWALLQKEHPDGDLSTYSSEELAELLQCPKYASSIKQALIDVGFMDADGSSTTGRNITDSMRSSRLGLKSRQSEVGQIQERKGPKERREQEKGGKGKDKTSIASSNASSITDSESTPYKPASSNASSIQVNGDWVSPLPLPEILNQVKFIFAWNEWVEHLEGKPLFAARPTEPCLRAMLAQCERLGPTEPSRLSDIQSKQIKRQFMTRHQ